MESSDNKDQGVFQQITPHTHIRVLKRPPRLNAQVEFVWLYSDDVQEFGEHYMHYLDRGYQPIDSGPFCKNDDGSALGGYVVFRHEQHLASV